MRRVEGTTLCRTTTCPREFVCLENDSRLHCVAVGRSNGGLLLEKANCPGCPYVGKCGESGACTCPTRAELHERYQV